MAEDGGPLPVHAGVLNNQPFYARLDSLPDDLANAVRFTRAEVAQFRAKVAALTNLPCGLPRCTGAREDPWHLITACTDRGISEARRNHLRLYIPQLLRQVFAVIETEARFTVPAAEERETVADLCASVLRRVGDDGKGVDVRTTEGRWIMFRCALAAPWGAAGALGTHSLARDIGAVFDAVPLRSSAINQIADVWTLWAVTATHALIAARKAAYARVADTL